MRFAWITALKELRRRLRDPVTFLLWLAIPLLVCLLLGLAFGSRGGTAPGPRVHLLIADEDAGFVSGLLVGAFSQEPLGALFRVEKVESPEGRRRLDRGAASALLIIPPGFGQALLERRPARLQLVKNPAQHILPEIAEQTLEILADGTFYLQEIFAGPLERIRSAQAVGGEDISDQEVAAVAIAVRRALHGAGRYLFPPALEVAVTRPVTGSTAQQDDRFTSIGALFLPGMIFMGLFFTAQSLSEEIWLERSQGTLARLAASPRSLLAVLGGKLFAAFVVLGLLATGALVGGGLLFDLPASRMPLAAAWSALGAVALVAALTLLQLYAPNARAGSLLSTLLGFPLLLAGGSFFPLEVMPPFLAAAGRLTPNGWALGRLVEILHGRQTPGGMLPAAGAVALATLALLLAAWRRARVVAGRP
ncbi:MAG: ABC transporter permease [Acidobacteriota bacterium]|nr:ABC transporter permease [Acidobacteriota bacterium]